MLNSVIECIISLQKNIMYNITNAFGTDVVKHYYIIFLNITRVFNEITLWYIMKFYYSIPC